MKPYLTIGVIGVVLWSCPVHGQEEIAPFNRRIVGGEKADVRQHPWQVALTIRAAGETYLCGGSVVAERWVATAAHCFAKRNEPGDVRVKGNVTNYNSGVWKNVDRIVIHAGYDPRAYEHDIALVRLVSSSGGKVIPLVTKANEPQVGQPLEVTGWGATREGGDTSRTLLKAIVPYVSNADCNAPDAYNAAIKSGMMCAGRKEGGVDSCQGDSGGPLVWRTLDGPVLVGLVSWGEGCARRLRYGVYTRITTYADWIEQVIASNSK